MRVIGHRGAAALAPENTLPSFQAALDAGVDAVELDARLTADGVVVVMHDDDVSRTTGAHGRISELTLDEVRALDAAASFDGWPERAAVPTIDEVLDLVAGRAGLVVELKAIFDERGYIPGIGVARAVVARVSGTSDVVVSSFDPAAVAEVRSAAPGIRTALSVLRGMPLDGAIDAARAAGHAELHPAQETVDAEAVAAVHAAGLTLSCWTVNDPERARALSGWGVDGVFSDDPAAVRAALG